jgi:calcineurin-like phosphoesterase family protein
MGKLWFSADHHFGHKNILDYCGRPFDDVHQMNKEMTRLWNETVRDEDRVVYVGDFALGQHGAAQYLQWLNGVMDPFVLGNHDRKKEWETLVEMLPQVKRVVKQYTFDTKDGLKVVVTHKPSWDKMRKNPEKLFVFGHLHNMVLNTPLPPNGVNVGVDCWGFKPVGLEEIRERVGM